MQTQLTKQETIDEITRLLVEFYRPVRIYLFGSGARGESGPDSDLDFLVVVPDDAPKEQLRGAYSLLRDIREAVDVILWRQTDFDGRAAYVRASLPATVIREGKLLYDAQRVPA
jgi:predicted nucleotidyltransferase